MSKRTFASTVGAALLASFASADASEPPKPEALVSPYSPPLIVVVSPGIQLTLKGQSYREAVASLDESGAIPLESLEGGCPGLVGVEYPAHNPGLHSPRFYCYPAGTQLIAPPASVSSVLEDPRGP